MGSGSRLNNKPIVFPVSVVIFESIDSRSCGDPFLVPIRYRREGGRSNHSFFDWFLDVVGKGKKMIRIQLH
jgi:hypothetical protein